MWSIAGEQHRQREAERPGQPAQERCGRAGLAAFDLVYHRSGDAGTLRQIGQGPSSIFTLDPDPCPYAGIDGIYHNRHR